MQLRSLLITGLFFICNTSFGQQNEHSVKGTILDAQSKEQLSGATITIAELHRNTSTRLDGSFTLEHINSGTYHFQISYIGYITIDTVFAVNSNIKIYILLRNASSALSEVVIAGRKANGESEIAAKRTEQNAASVQNIISAKAIQMSPDVTVGNALQRVSGVSVERSSSGDGRYAIIRGMDQRYNNTLINGVKIASPDNKSRFIPLDIFPSDLIERIEVNKTLTPNMEADAIGGTVNMVMKNAPDALYVNASASAGFNQNVLKNGFDQFPVSAINKQSPYRANGPAYSATPQDFTRDNLNYTHKSAPVNTFATLSIGNRFFKNRLGVMLGGSYQNVYKSYNTIFSPGEFQDGGQLYIKHFNVRDYSTELTRAALNGKVDFNINDKNKIGLYAIYADLQDAQARLTTDTLILAPRTVPGTGQIWQFGRSRYQHQNIFNTTLQGQHTIVTDRLKLDWSAVYSNAMSQVPDVAEYEYDGGIYADANAPGSAPYKHPDVLMDYDRTWWKNTDRDLTGIVNLSYNNTTRNIPYTVTVGGLYRDKHRVNEYDNYELRPVPNSDGSKQTWAGIYNYKWSVFNPKGSAADYNNYRANETIGAAYAMLKFKIKRLETVAGVRMEHTAQDYMTDVDATVEGKSGEKSYQDILPSVNFKYLLNDKTNIRLSYYSAIARPSYFEIVPYNDKAGDDFVVNGNPFVKHSTSQNFDVRYEWYAKPNEQLFVGAFYKKIHDPIEYGFNFTGFQNSQIYQPNNYGDAANYGLELVYEKYIGNFGVRANYTYTHSSITTTKFTSFRKPDGTVDKMYPEQTRPLQGQAPHVANVAVLYKNNKLGLDAQVTWQYTGKRIALVSPYYEMDYWQTGMSIFDLAAEKRIAKHFSVFVKVQNLLNAKYEVYVNKPVINDVRVPYQDPASGKTLTQRSEYGQVYQAGVRYIFKK
ncbi:TonB-dependent receptor [Pinibacter soli]|uniref:TonB-dependent receptor n=1 Tax=Pinibacter soli TaxID=3044211 RepID=A0ABT6RF49_9BACT|nr:TonB-dependent receptor [Pinibacter soli]MDI3321203.1 TonB-dependent receptor [Pinibacter soli]